MFSNLLSILRSKVKIVPGNSPASNQPTSTAPNSTSPTGQTQAPGQKPATQGQSNPSPQASQAPAPEVDMTAILDAMAAENSEKLVWRTSIVDLLKLVDMDSSLSARKELAEELEYTGDTSDSAKMNVWLHKTVMKKLAENGGKVPADLLD